MTLRKMILELTFFTLYRKQFRQCLQDSKMRCEKLNIEKNYRGHFNVENWIAWAE